MFDGSSHPLTFHGDEGDAERAAHPMWTPKAWYVTLAPLSRQPFLVTWRSFTPERQVCSSPATFHALLLQKEIYMCNKSIVRKNIHDVTNVYMAIPYRGGLLLAMLILLILLFLPLSPVFLWLLPKVCACRHIVTHWSISRAASALDTALSFLPKKKKKKNSSELWH